LAVVVARSVVGGAGPRMRGTIQQAGANGGALQVDKGAAAGLARAPV
jgi:hypothetical protein